MSPFLCHGDYVLVSRFYWRLKAGDTVVAQHPIYEGIIKRIDAISTEGDLWLRGDSEDSVSPEKMGWVKQEWLKGKVIWAIKSRA